MSTPQSLKALNDPKEISKLFSAFLHNEQNDYVKALKAVLQKLRALRDTLLQSPFFRSHEVRVVVVCGVVSACVCARMLV